MTHGSLFSGIGGFDLAAEWMGWENVLHCEINPFGRQVLKYYWPNAISYEDITTTDFTIHRGTIDILTGGFPCQPFSVAGKRKGTADNRHLWPEMLRAIREIQPRWIVGENVSGLVNWDRGLVFEQVQADLEAEGYEVIPFLLPAAGVDAPHKRERIWFVAHTYGSRSEKSKQQHTNIFTKPGRSNPEITTDTGLQRQEGQQKQTTGFEQLCEERTTANTPGIGLHQRGSGNNRPSKNGPSDRLGPVCEEITPDTENIGLQQPRNPRERGARFKDSGSEQITSDTYSRQRCERRMHTPRCKQTNRHACTRNSRFNKRETWDNFPTQPPVRGRNDGIPSGLVGITVPKHRNESIKAYGNAIVPQVVYQIFKAIEQYELNPKTK